MTCSPDRPDWCRPPSGKEPTQANGTWDEFQPVHGAYSPAIRDPLARELVEAACDELPYLTKPQYRSALEAWGRAEAVVRLLEAWLAENGPLADDGDTRPALDAQRLWEKRASDERQRLGLDPLSAAKLGRDVAASQVDLARLFADLHDDEGDDR